MISLRSLPRICVALAAARAKQLEAMALAACDQGEDFLEIRLDALNSPRKGLRVIERILRRRPDTAVLAACRRKENGGGFTGSVEEEMKLLDSAVGRGAALVDVEIETAEADPGAVERLREKARVVLSFHDFERTPPLARVLKRLRRFEADVYKIATAARKPSDNLRILEAFKLAGGAPLVALPMGEVGAAGRILAPARGAAFTFAAPEPEWSAGTAPGQLAASLMRSRFQAHRLKPSAKIYGVIADPIGHSMSPALHNRAFRSRRIDAVYLPFLVEPKHLADFVHTAEALPVQGFSVTIPHKQRVMRRLAGADSLARRIGAVNTVYRKRGKLFGTNTDALGITVPLAKRIKLNRSQALVVGAGGAARAALFALSDAGAEVFVSGRNPQRVRRLARACGVESLAWEEIEDRYFDVMVHCTPVGMAPHAEANLFPGRAPADLIFDMVYNPLETELIRHAREEGKETIGGLEMFIEQAAAQFEIWTGESAPRIAMRNAVLEVLAGG